MSNLTNFIGALPSAVSQGLIWGIMAIGVYITYRILDVSDLTVDGSFCTGGVTFVVLFTGGMNLWLAILIAFLVGALTGLVTGLLHTQCGIPAILAGILTQLGLWSVNLAIMSMKANVSINVIDKESLNRLLVSLRFVQDALYGGIAYIEPDYPSLVFAKDGEIYDFDGIRSIAIGGAYSVDWAYRVMHRWGWWDDEQPSDAIRARVEEQLVRADWKVDAVLSHTVPFRYIPVETFLPGIDQSGVDNSTERWLDEIEARLTYRHWFAGHYHTEKTVDRLRIMFNDILEFTPAVSGTG